MDTKCIVCNHKCTNTPYYKTVSGVVCEDCYETKNGIPSAYHLYLKIKGLDTQIVRPDKLPTY